MGQHTDVYLLTGFLGSGKTTLLNRMTRALPAGLKTLVLMNEFGDIGVDGTLVEKKGLTMIEISRGSIFCACVKADFLKALVEIHRDIQPDLLVIESTGVANPGDLLRNLSLPLFGGRFVVKESLCLLDAANFTAVYQAFQSIEDQIAASSIFVLNKTDLADPGEIERTEEIVSGIVDNPVIFRTTQARISFDWLGDALTVSQGAPDDPAEEPLRRIENVEEALQAAMQAPGAHDAPSDSMVSFVMAWQGGSADTLRTLLGKAPSGLARAKGFLAIQGKTMLLNWSINHFQLEEIALSAEQSELCGKIVFILRQESEAQLMSHLQAGGHFVPLTVLRPMEIMSAM